MSQIPTADNTPSEKPAVDYGKIARELKIPVHVVENVVRLLDDGNTIPFIARFRKDLTEALNEKQILEIKKAIVLHRALAERKAYVLKAIDSQGLLTEELKAQIIAAASIRTLEDIYSPYKPQKQSRALIAKQQGLEPLMEEILTATSSDVDLAARATYFVRVDKGLNSVDDVIRGVSDLLVEKFSASPELKNQLRQIVKKTATMVSKAVEEVEPKSVPSSVVTAEVESPAKDGGTEAPIQAETVLSKEPQAQPMDGSESSSTQGQESVVQAPSMNDVAQAAESAESTRSGSSTESLAATEVLAVPSEAMGSESSEGRASVASTLEKPTDATKKKKKKKKKAGPDPFKDYKDFKQALAKLSHHQYLALSRGERTGQIKLKIQADEAQIQEAAFAALVPAEHPFAEFCQKCAQEALSKVLIPSIEREVRRELTESAENHATEVFANNLRNLLLQPPLRNSRVLAIDPGFKSGCGLVMLDEFGNVLEHDQIYVVGNQIKRDNSKAKIIDWVQRHKVRVIAIGTGAACRQAEQMISDLITESFADTNIRYVMVNEAGASVYSVNEIGREELPDLSPAIRSAVSIGRRLQDPLSEFTKISPANIGIGMYQHDVKAKHLVESLNDIVESCVNQVGANVNTASVSLLKYVSGLNALTARRLIEHRQNIGGFKNRQQLKEVTGIGDATFVQAAGFLRIHDGENPLDSTGIHPESYPLAEQIVKLAQTSLDELFPKISDHNLEEGEPTHLQVSNTQVAEKPVVEIASAESGVAETAVAETAVAETAVAETAVAESAVAESAVAESAVAESESVEDTESVAAFAAPTQIDPTNEIPVLESKSDEGLNADSLPQGKVAVDEEVARKLEARKQAVQRLSQLDVDSISKGSGAGRMQVRDIILALKKPAWDPRDRITKPVFRRGILKLTDLKPEMQLDGQIVNVVDFGVFVDIGLGESSLVHVSQLSHRYVADPHRLFSVGNILRVWVAEIDSARRRVKLTAIQPGSKAPEARPRGKFKKPETSTTSAESNPVERSDRSNRSFSDRNKTTGRSAGQAGQGRQGGQSAPAGRQRVDSPEKRFQSQTNKGRFDGGRSKSSQPPPRKPKPIQPAPPITDGMLKGNEPMRSFSDLLQFVQKKPKQGEDKA